MLRLTGTTEHTMDTATIIKLEQQEDFRFSVHFDNPAIPALTTDEPPPLGGDQGPNPERLLGAAVANCLAASLLFAMRKFRNDPSPLTAEASISTTRNAQNRVRIGAIAVELRLGVSQSSVVMLERILAQFEDFCVVTQSVRGAIPVTVRVVDVTGALLHLSDGSTLA
jgi:organic hydroperoxide reductase OsmC/OhrA